MKVSACVCAWCVVVVWGAGVWGGSVGAVCGRVVVCVARVWWWCGASETESHPSSPLRQDSVKVC